MLDCSPVKLDFLFCEQNVLIFVNYTSMFYLFQKNQTATTTEMQPRAERRLGNERLLYEYFRFCPEPSYPLHTSHVSTALQLSGRRDDHKPPPYDIASPTPSPPATSCPMEDEQPDDTPPPYPRLSSEGTTPLTEEVQLSPERQISTELHSHTKL